jgi:hypothetical protein
MELVRANLRNFKKHGGTRNEVFDETLEPVEFTAGLDVTSGLLRSADELHAKQNWSQRIAQFMCRDGEKVIASADRVAQFGDQLIAGIRPVWSLWTDAFSAPAFGSVEASSEVSLGFLAIVPACNCYKSERTSGNLRFGSRFRPAFNTEPIGSSTIPASCRAESP